MILCVTPNTALDRTLLVPGYAAGGVFRPQHAIAAAGGKGVNVARVVRLLGGNARCFGFIAGYTGALVAASAATEGLDCRWTVLPAGETRTCTILVDPSLEQTTVVNESGVKTTSADWMRLSDDLIASAGDAEIICFCGSLPPGSPLDAFAQLLTDLRAMGKAVWIDSSGGALRAAAEIPGIHVKINDDEAAVLLGTPIYDIPDTAAGAWSLAQRLSAIAVITLGKRGAVMSDGTAAWHALPPPLKAKSAVGSGDSFLAGLLVGLQLGEHVSLALGRGVAAGAANALTLGGGHFALDDYQRILANTAIILQKIG